MTDTELAWVAGLLEGHERFLREDDLGVRIQLVLKDGKLLERLREVTGIGTVSGPFADEFARDNPDQYYRYVAGETRELIQVLRALRPFFSDETKNRVREVVRRLQIQQNP